MKKKLISLFLIGAMTTGMVAGCGSGNSNADAGNNASSDNAAVEGTEAAADGTESTFNGTYSNKQVILGESSETSGDITPFWANGASDYDAFKLVTGMAPIDKDQTGKWIENPAVLDNLEVTDNEDGSRTYTVKIKDGLKFSDGSDINADDYLLTYMLRCNEMVTDLEASNLTDSTVQYVKGYDAYLNGESDTFEGLHLIDDKTFSVTIDAQFMPYYYGQALISNQPESMDLWLPEDVTLEDTEDGVKFSDNFTSEYIGDKVQAARYDYNICSGPYMFTSYDENSYAYTLTKNPNFPGNFEGQTANIETVIVKYTPQDTMMDQLKNYYKEMGVDEKVFDYAQEVEKGLKDRFESYHGVRILDEALIAAATMSDRYITDRFLPDKAIDLVDEACATLKVEMESMPQELDELQRKILQLQIEKTSLQKEEDKRAIERREEIESELASLQSKRDEMHSKWEDEKRGLANEKEDKQRLEKARLDLEQARNEARYEDAAKLQYGTIPELEARIQKEQASQKEDALIQETVNEELIAKIVSRWTGVEVTRLVASERDKLLNLKEELEKRVVGQNEALELVTDAILRSKAQIQDENRPIGSFMFLGPTGVGKTEVAKALAEQLFDDERHIVRIDMSEYMEKHSVARLIGAPPGYVGYDEGGQLTEAVRRNPYSIVLFDEIEKAHPDVFNVLLQILDDGRITDSKGVTVDFKNTIIILTSNLGSQYAFESGDVHDKYMEEVKRHFKPEFINRIDEIIVFNALDDSAFIKIAHKFVGLLQKRLAQRDITLNVSDAVYNQIAKMGVDPVYGARPMKRYIQRNLETQIAKEMIKTGAMQGDVINVDCHNGEYTFDIQGR